MPYSAHRYSGRSPAKIPTLSPGCDAERAQAAGVLRGRFQQLGVGLAVVLEGDAGGRELRRGALEQAGQGGDVRSLHDT